MRTSSTSTSSMVSSRTTCWTATRLMPARQSRASSKSICSIRCPTRIEQYWEHRTKAESAKGQTGLTRSKNLFDKWTDRLACLEKSKRRLEDSLEEIDGLIAHQEEKYREVIAKEVVREGKMKEAQAQVDALGTKLDEMTRSVLDAMRGPACPITRFCRCHARFQVGSRSRQAP